MRYIKLNTSGEIEKYPYSIDELRRDNPNVSFSGNMPEERLAEWGVFPVLPADYPQVDHKKNVVEETPNNVGGKWYQDFAVVDASPEEIAEREAALLASAKQNRAEAYKLESDPLFFKWQRGEATQQQWLDKVTEIKARYPDPVF